MLNEAAPARLFEEVLKLFLGGHGVASFEGLERYGLLDVMFPESAAALRSNRSGALRRMVIEGLHNTDLRVANDEPVSPSFLFALLLWPAFCRALASLQKQGVALEEAQRRAADRVTLHQRKRVIRTLTHPRFRAAYDFLVLRQVASSEHEADVAFWREAQLQSGTELDSALDAAQADGEGEDGAPRKRRRRRRRPGGAAGE